MGITDKVVKIYRNFVILYSLRDVISQVYTCVINERLKKRQERTAFYDRFQPSAASR